jgi:PqqD family protein of HPr-rel-A system
MHPPAGSRWRLVDPSGLRIHRFGDDALVFNPVTWETHLLNGVAMRVLDVLNTAPMGEADLVEEIFATDGDANALAAKREEIARFLDELGRLDLAELDRSGP